MDLQVLQFGALQAVRGISSSYVMSAVRSPKRSAIGFHIDISRWHHASNSTVKGFMELNPFPSGVQSVVPCIDMVPSTGANFPLLSAQLFQMACKQEVRNF